ncbi:MAG: hypothetical protein ACRELY_07280 [Polyangiaceae bacterium]
MKLWGVGLLALSLAAAGAGVMTTSCSDSNLGTGQGDGGSQGCPANAPSVGSACLLANGTQCNYGAAETPNCECCGGGGSTYVCDNGKWGGLATPGSAGATPAAPACPATLPEAGAICAPTYSDGCQPYEQTCTYACTQGGTQTASCTGTFNTSEGWQISTTGNCDGDAGDDDAGDGGDASDGG